MFAKSLNQNFDETSETASTFRIGQVPILLSWKFLEMRDFKLGTYKDGKIGSVPCIIHPELDESKVFNGARVVAVLFKGVWVVTMAELC